MCGIFITNSLLVTDEHVDTINQTIGFRGPDGNSGLVSNGEWKSYHSRLSIINITPGTNQPVINKDKSQLVFNGEILNYKELGFKYFGKEYVSDTFLLNDLLMTKKIKLNELDGFYSFVFINGEGIIEYACRDKFGVKPLFYYEEDGKIAFSSEPSTLAQIFECTINEEAVEEYLHFRAPVFQGAFHNGVKQIEPGSCFVTGNYFNVEDELNCKKESVSLDCIENSLIDGIESRSVSDAPIGLLLSKGIDSNLIRQYSKVSQYYTVGFAGDADFEYLKTLNLENLTLHETNDKEFLNAFEYLLELRQEPMSVPNEVLLYIIAAKAKGDGIKVLLSGEGADEFFGGYDRIFTWASEVKKFDISKFLELYAYKNCANNEKIVKKINNLFEKVSIKCPFEMVRWFFIRYHMPILFRRLDFALMAAGVEGREPIANEHLFKWCKKLTNTELMVSGLGKRPLRELLKKHMGHNFAYEEKVGFPVDLTKVFENPKEITSYELWFEKNLEILK